MAEVNAMDFGCERGMEFNYGNFAFFFVRHPEFTTVFSAEYRNEDDCMSYHKRYVQMPTSPLSPHLIINIALP